MSNDLTKLWLADQKHSPLTPAAGGGGGGAGGSAWVIYMDFDKFTSLHTVTSGRSVTLVNEGSAGGTFDGEFPATATEEGTRWYDISGISQMNYVIGFPNTWNTNPKNRNDFSDMSLLDLPNAADMDIFICGRRTNISGNRGSPMSFTPGGQTVISYRSSSAALPTATGGTLSVDGIDQTTEQTTFNALGNGTWRNIRIRDCTFPGIGASDTLIFGHYLSGYEPEDFQISFMGMIPSADVDASILSFVSDRVTALNTAP